MADVIWLTDFHSCNQSVSDIQSIRIIFKTMTTSIPNFKKRKSFITLTRKKQINNNFSCFQPDQQNLLPIQPEWKSLILNHSNIESNRSSFTSQYSTNNKSQIKQQNSTLKTHLQLKKIPLSNKQNQSANRPLIKIKPHKYSGSCHLLWCKQIGGRSDLIRLQREDIFSSDFE